MTNEHRNIRAALDQEEARRVDDDYLSELQKVWRDATAVKAASSGVRTHGDARQGPAHDAVA